MGPQADLDHGISAVIFAVSMWPYYQGDFNIDGCRQLMECHLERCTCTSRCASLAWFFCCRTFVLRGVADGSIHH